MSVTVEYFCSDKKLINKLIKYLPHYIKSQLSKDEIVSDLNITLCNCAIGFNPEACNGNAFPYVRRAFINNLNKTLRDKQFFAESEAPLEAAYGMTYTQEEPEEHELMAYISSLPDILLESLTEFALGKKNKQELIDSPCFARMDIDRILDKLDALV